MKNSELRRLVARHAEIKQMVAAGRGNPRRLAEEARRMEHRYFHETGSVLE